MDNRTNDEIGPDRDTVAGATGSAGGIVAGAALGSLAGPIGTIIGGLAGAVGGWWAGKAVVDSPTFTNADDDYYQNHHQSNYASLNNAADQSVTRPAYNDVRPAYQLGHLAGVNPDYSSNAFDDVEPHLASAYGTAGHNNWTDVRQYAQDAWSRGRQVGSERLGSTGIGSTTGSDRTAFDGSSVNTGNSTLGDHGRDLRNSAANLADRAGNSAANLADRAADKIDDLKDRVDGNPASRPGRDSTDRPER